MIVCYRSDQVSLIWDKVKPFIEQALNRGSSWTLEEVHDWLLRAKCQLWTWQDPDIQAVMTTAIQGENCLILTMAGTRMGAWMPHLYQLETWAAQNGCTKLLIHGRKGWARFGFNITGRDGRLYILEREI